MKKKKINNKTENTPIEANNEQGKRTFAQWLKKALPFIKLACLIILLVGLPYLIYRLFPSIWYFINNEAELDILLKQNYIAGMFIYIGAQILQVVISVIPGEAVQIAGGYIYGVAGGLLLSIVGIGIGTFLAFRLARFMGRDAVVAIFGESKMQQVEKYMNGRRGRTIVFALFLIPAMPKDMLCYVAGVSSMREKDFYLLSMIGRIPALAGSMLMGSLWRSDDFVPLIIIAAVVVTLFVLGVIFREKLFCLADKFFDAVHRKK